MKETLLSELIVRWVSQSLAQKQYSATTMKQYRLYLEAFNRWAGEKATLADFTESRLQAYQAWKLASSDLRPRTINHMYCGLIAFGKWLVKQRLLPGNPAALVLEKVKLDPAERNLIADNDVFCLLTACDKLSSLPQRLYWKAVLAVLIHSGLRHSEILALCLTDFAPDAVNPKNYMLVVRHGKGNKRREVPLCKEASEIILAYLPVRPPDCREGAARKNSLFMYNRQQQLGHVGLNTIIRQAARLAGYEGHLTPHSFRHNYATRLLNRTHEIGAVSELLGHSQVSTTLNTYYHTDKHKMRLIAAQSAQSPVAEQTAEVALHSGTAGSLPATPQTKPPPPNSKARHEERRQQQATPSPTSKREAAWRKPEKVTRRKKRAVYNKHYTPLEQGV